MKIPRKIVSPVVIAILLIASVRAQTQANLDSPSGDEQGTAVQLDDVVRALKRVKNAQEKQINTQETVICAQRDLIAELKRKIDSQEKLIIHFKETIRELETQIKTRGDQPLQGTPARVPSSIEPEPRRS
jgi:TolA-binding protein